VIHFRLGNSHLTTGTDPATGRRNSALVAREAGPGDMSWRLGRRCDRPAARQALGRTWQALGLPAACREISSAASPNSSPVPLDLAMTQTPNVPIQTHLSHRRTRPRAEYEHGDPATKSERVTGSDRYVRRGEDRGRQRRGGKMRLAHDRPKTSAISRSINEGPEWSPGLAGQTCRRDRYSRKWHRTHPKDGRGSVEGANQQNPRHHRRTVPA
jgi:hypothetical protein